VIIDSHCHLISRRYEKPIQEIIDTCEYYNISLLLNISTKESEFNEILSLSKKYNQIYNSIGIHPHETENLDIGIFNKIDGIIKQNNKTVAVGETGLDFYYNNSKKNDQLDSFKSHIEASIELNVPVIVHSRNAELETFDILNKYKNDNLKILMHCFTGSLEFAEKLLDLNSYFSASGIITFKNSDDLQKTFQKIPLNKLLIETDSPFLAPVPMRGKKNEPSFIKYTLEKLAELKNIKSEQLEKSTNNNFNKLFFNL